MNSGAVIEANHLSKRFKIYASARRRLADWLHIPGGPRCDEFWALRDISFSVSEGECLGIIGPNGAGKSTLLKLLTGVLVPTSGTLALRGRVLSLLELGSDFNGELTGRQNAIESLQLLDVDPHRVGGYLEQIEAFAELGDYMDRPVRTYSSGMFVRLAFSLFSTMEPEVLLIDEALTVGDVRFAAKALGRIRDLRRRGTTLVFVSHNLEVVSQLCTRVVWLHSGQVQADGLPQAVTTAYHQFMLHSGAEVEPTHVEEVIDGSPAEVPLATATDTGLLLGDGWESLEAFDGEVFRWAGGVAELIVQRGYQERELVLDLEPAVRPAREPMLLCIDTGSGPANHVQVSTRQIVPIALPESFEEDQHVRLWTPDPVQSSNGDPRMLSFRVFGWGAGEGSELHSIQHLPTAEHDNVDLSLRYELQAMRGALARFQPIASAAARIVHVSTRNAAGDETVRFSTYDPIALEIRIEAIRDVAGLVVGMDLNDVFGRSVYRTRNDLLDDHLPQLSAGESVTLTFECPRLPLGHGVYQFSIGAGGPGREAEIWHLVERAWSFEIVTPPGMSFHGMVDLNWRFSAAQRLATASSMANGTRV